MRHDAPRKSGVGAPSMPSTPLAVDVGKTMRAWEDFLSGSPARGGQHDVRAIIADSWRRSASNGVNSLGTDAPRFEAEDDIELRRDSSAHLREAAQIPFAQLGRLLADTEAMLVLTDRDGVILDTIGDPRTLDEGREIHLEVGGIWNERSAGTNGIGTALWAGEPVFVHAAEHFCAGIKNWTCAGAPIRDPIDRSVIGVVDLSGPTGIFRPHNTALVMAAAREIESALAGRFTIERARLLDLCLRSGHGAHPDAGLVILDHEGRIVFARGAPQYLPVNGARRDISLGRYLIESGERMSMSDLSAALADEPRLKSLEQVQLDGRVRGFALEFAPGPAERSPVRRGAPAAPADPIAGREPTIVGANAVLLEALALTRRVAASRVPILFEGETGVGKELFARLAYSTASAGPTDPYVAMNCGAASSGTFGEELFGRAEGEGGRPGWPGRVELADGGVLCLDEIGEMPLELQPSLLRLLEDKLTARVGDPRPRQVDIMVIALTNRSLQQEVELGRFRRDLYFRISAVTIKIPPLRERRDDIPLLLEHFNALVAARHKTEPLTFTDEALHVIRAYDWPGNVRELRNMVELTHLVTDRRRIDPVDLPGCITNWSSRPCETCIVPGAQTAAEQLKLAERQVILDALSSEDGNVSRAATALGMSRATLYRKMRTLGIRRWTTMGS
ncbi:sigma-54-dependent Fis family transcriptional regulator [Acuticoccus sediminis]|uniref:sigma-54-dependent Fis family transcriptional regulator n=1 Tax=Acuticoccus sediminis TaxID=2184697 RepID=UPI00192E5B1E|nr:sigma-54-dependent Fis family transcriptional regulator [Acuticoccus sediminis]